MPVTQVVAARRSGAVRVAIGHGVGYGSVRGVKINREGPWAGPSGTSVGISLTRVVTGATRIVVSRGRTEFLVSTTTGRRLSPGTSANQMSPRSG
jgi:hypothetical protein